MAAAGMLLAVGQSRTTKFRPAHGSAQTISLRCHSLASARHNLWINNQVISLTHLGIG